MKIIVAKKDLGKLVSRMQGVVERKSTMPVLTCVLLRAEAPGTLRISATDLYMGLSGTMPCEVSTPGSVALPAKDLLERIKMMPDGPISLEIDGDGAAKIRAMGLPRRYTIRGIPGGDFPPLAAAAEGAPELAIERGVLRQLLAATEYAISSDETRPHLNSALFEWSGEAVRMVTTDGHRLSMKTVAVPGRAATASMLLAQRSIQELRRMCEEEPTTAAGETPATLRLIQSGSSAFFVDGTTMFAAQLVDATFPPYEQVIPKAIAHTVRLPRAMFADAIRAVAVASDGHSGSVLITLSKGKLLIEAKSSEAGAGSDEMLCDYVGADLAIGFSAKYVLDVLGALTTEEVELGVNGALDPLVMRSPGDDGFLAVVMPMRI